MTMSQSNYPNMANAVLSHSLIILLLFCSVFAANKLYASGTTSGLVDDFDTTSANDPGFVGGYLNFGENHIVNGVSSDFAFNGDGSYRLEQSSSGGQTWGIGLQRNFTSAVDVSQMAELSFWIYSTSPDTQKTIRAELLNPDGSGGNIVHTAIPGYDLVLNDALNNWVQVKIPLNSTAFSPNGNTLDLTQVSAINFLMLNNGPKSAAKVYIDNIAFTDGSPQPLPVDVGLVTDFEIASADDPDFIGSWLNFGENDVVNGVSSEQAYSGSNAFRLEQSFDGNQDMADWGVGTQISFTTAVDVSEYGRFSFWLRSNVVDFDRTVGIEFFDADSAPHQVSSGLEYDLNAAFENWVKVDIPLKALSFGSGGMPDFSNLTKINFLIRNNGQGKASVKIYLDDLKFEGRANTPAPQGLALLSTETNLTFSWDAVAGATGYNVYRTTTTAIPSSADLLTSTGAGTLNVVEPLPTGSEIHQYWVAGVFDGEQGDLSDNIAIGGPDVQQAMLLHNKRVAENAQAATDLIDRLFYEETGAQAGYYGAPGTPEADNILAKYGRVWAYDAGIGLSYAVHEKTNNAVQRARWLKNNSRFIDFEVSPGVVETIFGGWPFSINQPHRGDRWEDVRKVTGANSWALYGIAEFITSEDFNQLSSTEQAEFVDYFDQAINDLLRIHIIPSGPNQDLVGAGFTVKALTDYTDFGITYGFSYNDVLSKLGTYKVFLDYPPTVVPIGFVGTLAEYINGLLLDLLAALGIDFTEQHLEIRRRDSVTTEHNIDLIALLNYTLANYNSLIGAASSPSLTLAQVDNYRVNLRDATFSKLYNATDGRFITGRAPDGTPSPHTAIDNATWLTSALNLAQLTATKREQLASGLSYTVDNFTKEFVLNGNRYHGAHYFMDGFVDIYIPGQGGQTTVYHIEATAGMIVALVDFAEAFPSHSLTPGFLIEAALLWSEMQRFVLDNGFLYGSKSIQGLFEDMDASVSAIWFLHIRDRLRDFPLPVVIANDADLDGIEDDDDPFPNDHRELSAICADAAITCDLLDVLRDYSHHDAAYPEHYDFLDNVDALAALQDIEVINFTDIGTVEGYAVELDLDFTSMAGASPVKAYLSLAQATPAVDTEELVLTIDLTQAVIAGHLDQFNELYGGNTGQSSVNPALASGVMTVVFADTMVPAYTQTGLLYVTDTESLQTRPEVTLELNSLVPTVKDKYCGSGKPHAASCTAGSSPLELTYGLNLTANTDLSGLSTLASSVHSNLSFNPLTIDASLGADINTLANFDTINPLQVYVRATLYNGAGATVASAIPIENITQQAADAHSQTVNVKEVQLGLGVYGDTSGNQLYMDLGTLLEVGESCTGGSNNCSEIFVLAAMDYVSSGTSNVYFQSDVINWQHPFGFECFRLDYGDLALMTDTAMQTFSGQVSAVVSHHAACTGAASSLSATGGAGYSGMLSVESFPGMDLEVLELGFAELDLTTMNQLMASHFREKAASDGNPSNDNPDFQPLFDSTDDSIANPHFYMTNVAVKLESSRIGGNRDWRAEIDGVFQVPHGALPNCGQAGNTCIEVYSRFVLELDSAGNPTVTAYVDMQGAVFSMADAIAAINHFTGQNIGSEELDHHLIYIDDLSFELVMGQGLLGFTGFADVSICIASDGSTTDGGNGCDAGDSTTQVAAFFSFNEQAGNRIMEMELDFHSNFSLPVIQSATTEALSMRITSSKVPGTSTPPDYTFAFVGSLSISNGMGGDGQPLPDTVAGLTITYNTDGSYSFKLDFTNVSIGELHRHFAGTDAHVNDFFMSHGETSYTFLNVTVELQKAGNNWMLDAGGNLEIDHAGAKTDVAAILSLHHNGSGQVFVVGLSVDADTEASNDNAGLGIYMPHLDLNRDGFALGDVAFTHSALLFASHEITELTDFPANTQTFFNDHFTGSKVQQGVSFMAEMALDQFGDQQQHIDHFLAEEPGTSPLALNLSVSGLINAEEFRLAAHVVLLNQAYLNHVSTSLSEPASFTPKAKWFGAFDGEIFIDVNASQIDLGINSRLDILMHGDPENALELRAEGEIIFTGDPLTEQLDLCAEVVTGGTVVSNWSPDKDLCQAILAGEINRTGGDESDALALFGLNWLRLDEAHAAIAITPATVGFHLGADVFLKDVEELNHEQVKWRNVDLVDFGLMFNAETGIPLEFDIKIETGSKLTSRAFVNIVEDVATKAQLPSRFSGILNELPVVEVKPSSGNMKLEVDAGVNKFPVIDVQNVELDLLMAGQSNPVLEATVDMKLDVHQVHFNGEACLNNSNSQADCINNSADRTLFGHINMDLSQNGLAFMLETEFTTSGRFARASVCGGAAFAEGAQCLEHLFGLHSGSNHCELEGSFVGNADCATAVLGTVGDETAIPYQIGSYASSVQCVQFIDVLNCAGTSLSCKQGWEAANDACTATFTEAVNFKAEVDAIANKSSIMLGVEGDACFNQGTECLYFKDEVGFDLSTREFKLAMPEVGIRAGNNTLNNQAGNETGIIPDYPGLISTASVAASYPFVNTRLSTASNQVDTDGNGRADLVSLQTVDTVANGLGNHATNKLIRYVPHSTGDGAATVEKIIAKQAPLDVTGTLDMARLQLNGFDFNDTSSQGPGNERLMLEERRSFNHQSLYHADFDGNGQTDTLYRVVYSLGGGAEGETWYLSLNDEDVWRRIAAGSHVHNSMLLVGDFDGDAYAEVLITRAKTSGSPLAFKFCDVSLDNLANNDACFASTYIQPTGASINQNQAYALQVGYFDGTATDDPGNRLDLFLVTYNFSAAPANKEQWYTVTSTSNSSWTINLANSAGSTDLVSNDGDDAGVTTSISNHFNSLTQSDTGAMAALAKGIHLGDFNGDGLTDVFTARNQTSEGVWSWRVALNSSGSLANSVPYNIAPSNPKNYRVGDFGGDGFADVLVMAKTADEIDSSVTATTSANAQLRYDWRIADGQQKQDATDRAAGAVSNIWPLKTVNNNVVAQQSLFVGGAVATRKQRVLPPAPENFNLPTLIHQPANPAGPVWVLDGGSNQYRLQWTVRNFDIFESYSHAFEVVELVSGGPDIVHPLSVPASYVSQNNVDKHFRMTLAVNPGSYKVRVKSIHSTTGATDFSKWLPFTVTP